MRVSWYVEGGVGGQIELSDRCVQYDPSRYGACPIGSMPGGKVAPHSLALKHAHAQDPPTNCREPPNPPPPLRPVSLKMGCSRGKSIFPVSGISPWTWRRWGAGKGAIRYLLLSESAAMIYSFIVTVLREFLTDAFSWIFPSPIHDYGFFLLISNFAYLFESFGALPASTTHVGWASPA
jgi:hypothetical protein